MNTILLSSGLRIAACLLLAGAGLCAMVDARAAGLEEVAANWPEAELKGSLDDPGMAVELGRAFGISITSAADANLAIVLVNPSGKHRVIVPQRPGTADHIVPGEPMAFPDTASGEALFADMPPGQAAIWLVASEKAIFKPQSAKDDPLWLEADQVRDQIANARRADPQMRLATYRMPLTVLAPETRTSFSTEEFVQFFTVGTRSIEDPGAGLAVAFGSGKATLTDWGRRQLDAVSRGMKDNRLTGFRFKIEGHTDQVGSADKNLTLSKLRAQAVRDYLKNSGVPEGRLDCDGLGESRPAKPGDTEAAYAANRRVVIQRLDKDQSKAASSGCLPQSQPR